ncbi:hypothetical protein C8Q73DRAFT_655026, partial [Cubamyces lactineus]
MSEQYHNNPLPQPDAKRRKLDAAAAEASQSNGDKTRGGSLDRAKANYLSGQLRLRLQYAKLKVEHGWQKQSLNEVENLYFRHTHLTRPYPVISPGGRRNGRTASNGTAASMTQPIANGTRAHQSNGVFYNTSTFASPSNTSLRSCGTLGTSSSSISADTTMNPSVPSTPNLDGGRNAPTAAPQAPHLGFNAATRYPISRSDSTATV